MMAHVDDYELTLPAPARTGKAKSMINHFRRSEEGSIIIFSLFLLIMMLMISGMAVDLMRSETHRARLQSTLDRAVLAGASLEQTLDSEAVVLDYFQKAGLGDYIKAEDINVIPGPNSKTVNAIAEMNISPYFMQMLGVTNLYAPASGQAEESLSNIEISLILDVSGSMGRYSYAGGASKIQLLRDAAKDFVYLMQCNPDDPDGDGIMECTVEDDTVSISLVPYAEQVLVGEDLLQQFNPTNEHTDSSCVDFVQADFSSDSISLTSPIKRSGDIDARTNYRSSRSWSKNSYNSRLTCRPDSYREITPLSNSYSDLQDQIDLLQASGYTSIDLGMKWGTALLSPDFRPAANLMANGGSPAIANAFQDRPYEYNERSMQKVIVLMTDGENTSQYELKDAYRSGPSPIWIDPNDGALSAYRSSTGQYWHVEHDHWRSYPDGNGNAVQMDYEDFWAAYNVDFYQEEFWWLTNPVNYYGYSAKNTRLDAICDEAKSHDIEVFTIGFETSSASNLIMQQCSSSESHHFDVNGDDLATAFDSIAREIHELRLTN